MKMSVKKLFQIDYIFYRFELCGVYTRSFDIFPGTDENEAIEALEVYLKHYGYSLDQVCNISPA